MVREASEGDGMFESSRVELEEKREPKRVALSVGETAIVVLRIWNSIAPNIQVPLVSYVDKCLFP